MQQWLVGCMVTTGLPCGSYKNLKMLEYTIIKLKGQDSINILISAGEYTVTDKQGRNSWNKKDKTWMTISISGKMQSRSESINCN